MEYLMEWVVAVVAVRLIGPPMLLVMVAMVLLVLSLEP